MKIGSLMTNRMVNPLGFNFTELRLSYKVTDTKAKKQAWARVTLATDPEMKSIVYDSGERGDINSLSFTPDLSLLPRTRYYWQVEAAADNGERAKSDTAWFETAKIDEPFEAQWISADWDLDEAMNLKKRFSAQDVVSARAYVCGLGLYELYINGQKAGDEYLTPNCNAYDKWLQYQTYDVTGLIAQGENDLCVMLADGWYKGRFGFRSADKVYGDTEALILELRLKLKDGSEQVIASDLSWKAQRSKIRFANIYDGEIYDATFSDDTLYPVKAMDLGFDRLTPRLSPPVIITEKITPKEIIKTPKGETVLDLGQEITGWLAFKTRAPKGTKLHLSYGEILQGGNFYRDNLRSAKAEYTYISDGSEREVRPYFTYFGFRYIKLEGFGEDIQLSDFTGCVVHSTLHQIGRLKTSNEKVNRLILNALWGQRGNYLDVPTDCPQRDERMGWTGDAQAFAATACFNMDSAAFLQKYLYDMQMEQDKMQGGCPHVVPAFEMYSPSSCAWGDAAAIIPWTLYMFYGDKTLLKQEYRNMRDWVEYIHNIDEQTGGHRLWTVGFHFGDWLALDAEKTGNVIGGTDTYYIASAFYYYSTSLLVKAAKALGYEEDIKKYEKLQGEILSAIRREYLTPTGRLAETTQTAYVVGLMFGLIPEEFEERNAQALREKLKLNDVHLRTGFVGTSYLNRVLSAFGSNDYAYQLLLNEDYPSWLYEVNMGATTVWERWNSVLPDGSISDTGMNSLNHYAYGAIVEWIYRDVAGINPTEQAPGFKKALIRPRPNFRLPKISAEYDSAAGLYKSAWEIFDDGRFVMSVSVPFDASAEIVLPHGDLDSLKVNGECPCKSGLKFQVSGDDLVTEAPAGDYTFEYVPVKPLRKVLSVDSPVVEIIENKKALDILIQHVPDMARLAKEGRKPNPSMTLRSLANSMFVSISDEQLEAIDKELGKL